MGLLGYMLGGEPDPLRVMVQSVDLRWLFIIEGGITILAAGLSLFILPDYPHS